MLFGGKRFDLKFAAAGTSALSVAVMLTGSPVLGLAKHDKLATSLTPLVKTETFLFPSRDLAAFEDIESQLESTTRWAWQDFVGVEETLGGQWNASIDTRSGLLEIAEGSGVPWVPGYGNELKLSDIGQFLAGRSEIDIDVLERIAREFISEIEPLLGTSGYQLRLDREASMEVGGYLWFVQFDLLLDGIELADAHIFFRVNHGNLVQFGGERVVAVHSRADSIQVSRPQARAALDQYVGGFQAHRDWFLDRGTVRWHSVRADLATDSVYTVGAGYGLRPVWQFVFRRDGEAATWRARVDATSGEILEFVDLNRYAEVTGGYWPVSWRVGGVEQPQVVTGWPYTTVNPTGGTSNTSGIYSWDGSPQTARHVGPYINIADQCLGSPGTASSGAGGDIDFGSISVPNAPGDCQDQNGINHNTPASRQQFWHLNKIMEKGRTYLPANAWLQSQVTANVNINNNCNAFWNGSTVNFYTSGGGCGNTGEDAGIALHEWGHGMDSNDGNGTSVENGTGETYGDFSATLQTLDSCTGWGFLGGNCSGYGNPCTSCDGVRDIDWGRHDDNIPMTVASFTGPECPSDAGGGYVGPCGLGQSPPNDKEGHCESLVSSGALFDLAGYDLQAGCGTRNATFPDWNCPGAGGPYNPAGAWGVVDRLWYMSRPTANQAFSCNIGALTSNGCNAGSNWRTFRLVDDDDGNLANGTPHACQIAEAFNRHGIGNSAGSSCAGDNTTCFRACPQPAAPTLDPPTAGNNQITLNWSPDPVPDVIDVFRNEVGCAAGFTKIAEDVSGTFVVDNAVANGTTYYYQVVRHPVGNESCGSAPSNCVAGTPAAGPSAKYVTDSADLIAVPSDNDADGFVDNCETGRIEVAIVNDGIGTLNNVRFTITSSNSTVATSMPVNVGTLAVSSQATATFDFDLDGVTCAQSIDFDISVTADEMTGSNLASFSHGPVEQDLVLTPSRTDDFETDNDGWGFVQGYARENVTAASGVWSVHSSSGLDDQLDAALSPIFQIGAGASQVVIAERHAIETPFWDRANVHAIRLSDNTHTLLTPTGRTYTAGGPWNAVGHVGTQPGWAGTQTTWGDATFDLSGLDPGESYQLELNHNTDASVVETGHWFDNVRWTNVSFQVCDAQSDLCTPCTPPSPPTGVIAAASAPNTISVAWLAVAPAPSQYRIYRSTTPGGPYAQVGSVGGGILSFDDTGLIPGQTYYYVVRSFEVCESSDSNEGSATAFGDCLVAPTFGGVASVAPLNSGGSCGLRLEWSSGTNNCNSAPLVYNVYRSTSPGVAPGPGTLLESCVTTTFYDDTTALSGTTYYYIVQAEDGTVGGGGTCRQGNVDGNIAEQSGVVGGSGTVTLYSNDFETGSGQDDWDWVGFGGGLNNWRGIQTCAANSGSDIFRFGGTTCTGNYTDNSVGNFIAGVPDRATGIVVPAGATNTRLTFAHRRQFETFFGTAYDGAMLLVSLDDNNYTYVSNAQFNSGGYSGTLANSGCLPAFARSRPSWTATSSGYPSSFDSVDVDLDAVCDVITGGSSGCAGQTLHIGFTAVTDTCSGTAFDGWFLDDVEVTADTPSACSPAPGAVQFLTATATGTGASGQNVLEWINPGAGGYDSTMIRYSTANFPSDPSDGVQLTDQDDGLGNHGTVTHSGLSNGTTYYYSAFVDNGSGEYSARRTVAARPFDSSGNVQWAYSTGASALAPPGIGSVFGVANDRVLHSMDTAGGGTWPATWTPLAMNAPAQSRPPIVPVAIGAATKVAFLGSQDHRVYAVDAETGAAVWSSPDLGAMVQGSPAGIFTAFGGAYDLLLAGTRNALAGSQFHGLDLANGTVAWTFTNAVVQGGDGQPIGVISGDPVVDWATTRVYFASRRRSGGSSNTVWCLDFTDTTATLVWARDLGEIDGSPILHSGKIYVGNNAGEVHAVDAATGADLWASPFAGNDGPVKGYVWPRFGTDELIFSTTNRLWSITDTGGTATLNPNWPETTIANPSIPLAFDIGSGSYVWVGSSDGRLYQLDLDVADPPASKTSVTLGDGSATVGSAALDFLLETVFVGTENGRVYSVTLPLP